MKRSMVAHRTYYKREWHYIILEEERRIIVGAKPARTAMVKVQVKMRIELRRTL